jgi:long-chain fatty acid transport protein
MKMKIFTKFALALVAAMTITTTVFAGGPMTNSNQSASFLRSIARGTSLDPDAVYNNPAGVVFMDNGFHIGINDQMAKQTRTVTSTYAPFAMSNGNATKEYVGEVFSPAIPSVHFAWKHNRWAVMVGMGVNGGGGSLEFADGLASFERQFSVLPGAISQLGQQLGQMNPAMAVSANRYSMDMYLKGNSMTLAFNAGVAFRITDWLSVAAQLRYSTTSNGYEGYMKNIQINPTMAAMGLQGDMMSAAQFFTAAGAALGQLNPALAQQAAVYAAQTADHILDVKQKGTSISPVLALAFHKGKWDASVKYEFKMATELEIESEPISANDPVINGIFPNGAKVKSETPALLTAALSRHFGSVKVTAEWHNYFDKDAQNSFSPCITGNTNEYLLGAEWSISDKWLVSAGVQRTALNMDINKYSDMNFVTSSTSVAAGVKYNFSEKVGLNLGIMPTFYDKETAVGQASGINFTDVYHRTSIAWGIGLDLKFGRK